MRHRATVVALGLVVAACSSGAGTSQPRTTPSTTRRPPAPVFDAQRLIARTVNTSSVSTRLRLQGPTSDSSVLDDNNDSSFDFATQRADGNVSADGESYRWIRDHGSVWVGDYFNDSALTSLIDTEDVRFPPEATRANAFAPLAILGTALHAHGTVGEVGDVTYTFTLPAKARSVWLVLLFGSHPYSASALLETHDVRDGTGSVQVVAGRIAHLEVIFRSKEEGTPSDGSSFTLSDFGAAVPEAPPSSAL